MGNKMINARAETVDRTPAYRSAFATPPLPDRGRRLLRVAGPRSDQPKKKVPYYFSRADGRPLTFAGLYETWWDKIRSSQPDPETLLRTCTIITTGAGPDMVEVHNRMPVILEEQVDDGWLDRRNRDTDSLRALLLPAPAGTLHKHPVSTEVNSPRHDGPELLAATVPTLVAGSGPIGRPGRRPFPGSGRRDRSAGRTPRSCEPGPPGASPRPPRRRA